MYHIHEMKMGFLIECFTENSHNDMNTNNLNVGRLPPNAHSIRVEVSSDQSLLVPHGDFVFAELHRESRETKPLIEAEPQQMQQCESVL
jgi:hypothetical protein